MTPTEAQRFELQQKLIEVLKERPANTLMESLPPMDWHELATKDDLAALEDRMDARFEVVDIRFEALRTELGAKIDTGLTDLNAKIDTGLADVRGETKLGLAKQTYVILAGVAAALAAAMTPVYIALFAGLGA